ncbi:hypothetical protein AFLA_000039, partial [Aspergillus flavus NRRL3357]
AGISQVCKAHPVYIGSGPGQATDNALILTFASSLKHRLRNFVHTNVPVRSFALVCLQRQPREPTA